jgi:CheY-like chemotaxis protein
MSEDRDFSTSGPCVCGFGEEYFTLEANRQVCSVCGGLVGRPSEEFYAVEQSDARRVILVVDDQGFFRERLSSVIKEHGHDVLQATDGVGGIKIIADFMLRTAAAATPWHIDAIILDLVMPGELDGFQTLAVVRAIVPQVPVIILTASPPTKDLLQKLARLGAKKYLNKAAGNLDQLIIKNLQEVLPTA